MPETIAAEDPPGPADLPGGHRLLEGNATPRQLTSFVGRERELAEINRLLGEASTSSRLLTLTGPGGCGKTRLAVRVTENCRESYGNGVAVVELAALVDASLAPQFLASALGVLDVPGRPIVTTLVEQLRQRDLLVVLDNCEHLVDACAALVETLLLACPRLSILATSREMLGVPGEIAWAVPALSTPGSDALTTDAATLVREAPRYEAIRLFVERARLVQPSFQITTQNVATLVRICRRLDGMPLPIELSAARVRHLSLEQIEERLNDCFVVLSAGSRTSTARHRTLWATIDWSYGLLEETKRALFRRLSVFAGGFTLEAAEAVCGASLGLLGQLVDKSLVVAEHAAGGNTRYRLLETIRQYAAEQLRATGEVMTTQRAHAEYFLQLAETAEPWLTSSQRGKWRDRLVTEYDNLRVTIAWSQQGSGEIEVGLRLAGALWWFWNLHAQLSEGRAKVEALLTHPDSRRRTAARAKALTSAGAIAWLQNDYATGRAWLAESVEIWREVGGDRGLANALAILALAEMRLGDLTTATAHAAEGVERFRAVEAPWGLAMALNNLGYVNSASGDYPAAQAHLAESIQRFRELGDTWGVALALSNRGYLDYRLGEYSRARASLEESLAIWRALDHRWPMLRTLNGLGNVLRGQGEYERATQLYEESLRLCRAHGDRAGVAASLHNLARVAKAEGNLPRATELFRQGLADFQDQQHRRGIVECLVGLAGVAAIGGQPGLAVRLFRAAELSQDEGAPVLSPVNRAEAEQDLALARSQLAPTAFATYWERGQSLSLDEAIEEAVALSPSTVSAVPPSLAPERSASPMTTREEQVALLVARGLSNRQIAEALVISERTADSHVAHILTKLGFASRAQIAAWIATRADA
jgi:predicted ATPase/DNA-binding CsgD family transcriptional regulator/tetratricopeptide (TPR) repeat protein